MIIYNLQLRNKQNNKATKCHFVYTKTTTCAYFLIVGFEPEEELPGVFEKFVGSNQRTAGQQRHGSIGTCGRPSATTQARAHRQSDACLYRNTARSRKIGGCDTRKSELKKLIKRFYVLVQVVSQVCHQISGLVLLS